MRRCQAGARITGRDGELPRREPRPARLRDRDQAVLRDEPAHALLADLQEVHNVPRVEQFTQALLPRLLGDRQTSSPTDRPTRRRSIAEQLTQLTQLVGERDAGGGEGVASSRSPVDLRAQIGQPPLSLSQVAPTSATSRSARRDPSSLTRMT